MSTDRNDQSNRWSALLQNASAFALIIGVVAYGGLYLAYDYVYSEVGVRPEEVGLDYFGILTRSAGALVIVAPVLIMLLTTANGFNSVAKNAEAVELFTFLDRLSGWAALLTGLAVLAATIGFAITLLSILTGFIVGSSHNLLDGIEDAREAVSFGETLVEPIRVFGLTVLDIRVEPARFDWIEPPTVGSGGEVFSSYEKGGCFAYFGSANGFVVGIDPNKNVVLRLPEDKVLIFRGAGSCAEGE